MQKYKSLYNIENKILFNSNNFWKMEIEIVNDICENRRINQSNISK